MTGRNTGGRELFKRAVNFRRVVFNIVVIGLLGGCLAVPATGGASGLEDRDSEPVVITGQDTPLLIGADPDAIVAFRYLGGWQQVPVQVDERKMLDYRPIRQQSAGSPQFMALGYADPSTWAEADGVPQTLTANPKGSGAVIPGTTGDPTLDGDDEIAMMAQDAADSAAGKPGPEGVDPTTRTPVRVTDPLAPGAHRFVYLFRTTNGLDPAAGTDMVSYEQKYSPTLSGPYRTSYNYNSIGDNVNGPPVNPEDTTITTSRYEIGIPGRWMIDRMVIAAGDGSDILDGDKSTVGMAGCGRNELTFSRGGGGFIANIDGPVRAIRSFIGANSGTYTQREYVFYEGLFENRTWLRVHPGINQFVQAMDLSPAAEGMTYRNSNNTTGVYVDGVQDAPVAGPFTWEQYAGEQGSVTNVSTLDTDIEGLSQSSYYQDLLNPDPNSSMLCSGDDHSFGAAGTFLSFPAVPGGINTDPTIYPNMPLKKFAAKRFTWFDGPEADATLGALRSEQVDNPIAVETGLAADPEPAPQPEARKPRLTVKVKPARLSMRSGARRAVWVSVRNSGGRADRVKLCVKVPKRKVKAVACRGVGPVAAGSGVARRIPIALKRKARKGSKAKVVFRLFSPGTTPRAAGLRIKVKRR